MPVSKEDAAKATGTAVVVQPASAPEGKTPRNVGADLGTPTPPRLRELAKKLPEKDEVQKATKAAMLAEDSQTEAKEKAKVVDASPDAAETPSGYALKKVTGISNDTERGEEYARLKAGVRHGYVEPE